MHLKRQLLQPVIKGCCHQKTSLDKSFEKKSFPTPWAIRLRQHMHKRFPCFQSCVLATETSGDSSTLVGVDRVGGMSPSWRQLREGSLAVTLSAENSVSTQDGSFVCDFRNQHDGSEASTC